jgi:hypothetical protein
MLLIGLLSKAILLENDASGIPEMSCISSALSQIIYSSKFIIDNVSSLFNVTIKKLVGGDSEPVLGVNMELIGDERKNFTGVLYRGKKSSIAVTQYEIKNNKKEKLDSVFHLKDIAITALPCEHSIHGSDGKNFTLKISEIPIGTV